MKDLVIVAIPSNDDPVWRYSSEEVPHMTLLYLGEQPDGLDTARMEEFVEHVVNSSMNQFGMSVDSRGTLGDKDADVLFFNKDYCPKMLNSARSYFLADPNIKRAYDSTDQYPIWIPHLTMGYPESPAKTDERDYPGFSWVNFDRIGFWIRDYDGPEYKLKTNYGEVSMSTPSSKKLVHYGVKGMKWGVSRNTLAGVSALAKSGAPVAKAGLDAFGKRYVPDPTKSAFTDHVNSKGGLHKVSDKDLQAMLNRMNMEQNYSRFMQQEAERRSAGKKSAIKFLFEAGKFAVPLVVGLAGGPAASAATSATFKAGSVIANKVLDRSGTLGD